VLRRLVPVALALPVLAACGAGAPPEVTFAAGAESIVAGPTQYCQDDFVTCTNDAAAPVALPVPPGTPLVVTVPDAVSETPWQIVFTYRDATGEQIDERTTVFPPQQREMFSLELPADARLLTAQVQQFGPPPQIDDATGEVVFPIRSSWVLTVRQ
jgi:hypothetical protein